jgi:hypothetical protein
MDKFSEGDARLTGLTIANNPSAFAASHSASKHPAAIKFILDFIISVISNKKPGEKTSPG